MKALNETVLCPACDGEGALMRVNLGTVAKFDFDDCTITLRFPHEGNVRAVLAAYLKADATQPESVEP